LPTKLDVPAMRDEAENVEFERNPEIAAVDPLKELCKVESD